MKTLTRIRSRVLRNEDKNLSVVESAHIESRHCVAPVVVYRRKNPHPTFSELLACGNSRLIEEPRSHWAGYCFPWPNVRLPLADHHCCQLMPHQPSNLKDVPLDEKAFRQGTDAFLRFQVGPE